MTKKADHDSLFKELKREKAVKAPKRFFNRYSKKNLLISTFSMFLLLCIYARFGKTDYLKVNKDLVDTVSYVKDRARLFENPIVNVAQSDIEFKELTSFKRKLLLGNAKERTYILNVAAKRNFEDTKLEIVRLKAKGLDAMYIKGDELYFIVIGYFSNIEDAEKAGSELFKKGLIKNYYPRYVS